MMHLRQQLTSIMQNMVLRTRKTDVNGGLIMEENLYKKLKSVGASNLVFGILIILFGIGAGVMMIINGARLLAHRSDSLF